MILRPSTPSLRSWRLGQFARNASYSCLACARFWAALIPDGLDLTAAAAVPLNSLAAAQIVDLLGDGGGRSLLVTGAATAHRAVAKGGVRGRYVLRP